MSENWRRGGGVGGGGGDVRSGSDEGNARSSPWRSGGGAGGDRPRLNLKSSRGGGADTVGQKMERLQVEDSDEKKRREPEITNSRAAAFGDAPAYKRESNNNRRGGGDRVSGPGGDRVGNRAPEGPPPVRNARFERMAEEERSARGPPRESGPPPTMNSRFSAAADADRSYNRDRDDRGNNNNFSRDSGPPANTNSRFSAAADADRSYNRDRDSRDRDSRPPPTMNSRFSAAADADRSYNRDRDSRDNSGPPPVANSRFAAAAQVDGMVRSSFDARAPPPQVNSRFAAAAARASEDMPYQQNRRNDYRNDGGPAMPQNSRFAAAAAADIDYMDRDERYRRQEERQREREDRYGGGYRGGGGMGNMPNAPRSVREQDDGPPMPSRVDELLKAKAKEEAVVVPASKEHEANMLQFPAKALKKEEDSFLTATKKKASEPVKVVKEEVVPIAAVSSETAELVITEFASGSKQGDDLKAWVEEKRSTFPTMEKLLLGFLEKTQKMNPDPECAWAEAGKFGAAFLLLAEDDLFNQMQILWAIQLYCDGLGFPKLDGESVVQSMFRSMYKYDLVDIDAFMEWKEDESDAHEKGKMTAIIQTVDWFNWLEEDDEEEEDYEE